MLPLGQFFTHRPQSKQSSSFIYMLLLSLGSLNIAFTRTRFSQIISPSLEQLPEQGNLVTIFP